MSESAMLENLVNFEKKYPFYMLDLEAFLGRVKRFVLPDQNGNVNMAQLIYAFEKLPNWSEIKDPTSLIREYIGDNCMRPEDWVAPSIFANKSPSKKKPMA